MTDRAIELEPVRPFTIMNMLAPKETRKRRLQNALWGLFIGNVVLRGQAI